MSYEFKMKRRIEFADTDMAGIMHFANFFRHMEVTEHEFYRSLGLSVHPRQEGQIIGWPRVSVSCDYKAPLHFEDEVEIHLLVREKRSKSITYTVVFHKIADGQRVEVACGSMTVVSVTFDLATRAMKAVSIPRAFADKIEVAPKELFIEEVK